MSSQDRLDSVIRALWGHEIDYYARGAAALDKHAVSVCLPAAVALSLPEEYAALVLTSRMDNELQKLIANSLHRNGNANELLFGRLKPLSSFSAKIDVAYAFDLVTEHMRRAMNFARKIRNEYAHTENPDEARKSQVYLAARNSLESLDPAFTADCIDRFGKVVESAEEAGISVIGRSNVTAIMLEMCSSLGIAAFYSQAARMSRSRPNVIPAMFGNEHAQVDELLFPKR